MNTEVEGRANWYTLLAATLAICGDTNVSSLWKAHESPWEGM